MPDTGESPKRAASTRDKCAWLGAIATLLAALIGAWATMHARAQVYEAKSEQKTTLNEASRLRSLITQRDREIVELREKLTACGQDGHPTSTPLDNSVPILSSKNCWEYVESSVSIGGRAFDSYAVINHRCNDGEMLTFDVRGWNRFESFVGIADNTLGSGTLTVKVDGEQVAVLNTLYDRAKLIQVDLRDHRTLTFIKSRQFPLTVLGEPKLLRNTPSVE